MKFGSQYLQYLQSYLEIFVRHLASAVSLLETDNISPVCRYIIMYRDMICFDGLYPKKSRSACSVLGKNIDVSFGPNGAWLGAL